MMFLAIALIAMLSMACSEPSRHSPTTPTATATAVVPPPAFVPNVAPPFPAVSKPARIYVMTIESQVTAYNGGALKARYVLHEDGTFTLQYASARFGHFEYPGTYEEANGEIFFSFGAGSSGATATVTEEFLTVSYSLLMQHSDFEDGVFERVRD